MVNKNSKAPAFVPHIQLVHNYGASNSISLRWTHHDNHICSLCPSNNLGTFENGKAPTEVRYGDKEQESEIKEMWLSREAWGHEPELPLLLSNSGQPRAVPTAKVWGIWANSYCLLPVHSNWLPRYTVTELPLFWVSSCLLIYHSYWECPLNRVFEICSYS